MLKRDDDTKNLLIEIIELVGYLGFGITLWELTKNVLIMIIYVLVLFYILLFLRYRARVKEITKLGNLVGEAEKNTEELHRIEGLFQGMLGLFMITAENSLLDGKHHYKFIQEEYIVHGDDGIYNWHLQGCNITEEPSVDLIINFAGDTPVDFQSLALSVADKSSGERYNDDQIKAIKDFPYLKIIELLFPRSLKKGDCFDLVLSCRWDNTIPHARKYDYVFFAWGYHAVKGIDKLVGRLVCDVPISDYVLERIDGGHLVKEHRQPKLIDTSAKRFILEWEVSNPQHVYLLRFTKEIDDINVSRIGSKYG